MAFTREQYSRKASMDVRSACARAIQHHFEELIFEKEGSKFRFTAVHDSWPSYTQDYIPPSCCILPGAWKYGPSNMTPTLIESSWEPVGQMGFGLYKTDELECEFEVSIRTDHVPERNVIILGIEDSFQAPEMLMSETVGPRNCIFLPLPDYYDLQARFALLGGRVIDSEEQAMREQRVASFTVSVQAEKVKLGPVAPLALKIITQCMDDLNACRR